MRYASGNPESNAIHGEAPIRYLFLRTRWQSSLSKLAPLSAKERDVHEAGLVGVLKEIHDAIDAAVLRAYGWDDLIEPLVGRPGATTPSPHKTA